MLSRFADSSFAVFLLLVSVPALLLHLIVFRQSWCAPEPFEQRPAGHDCQRTAACATLNCPGEDAIAAYEELIDSTLRGRAL